MNEIKKTLVIASILLANSAFADMDYFVGLKTGTANVTLQSTNSNGTSTGNQNANFLSITNGIIVDDRVKLSVGYSQYDIGAGNSMNSIEFGYSYYLDNIAFQLQKKEWRPFVNVDYVRSSLVRNKIETNSDTILLGFGTDYNINKKLFLMAGYGFSIFSASDNASQQVKDISKAYFDLNYKF